MIHVKDLHLYHSVDMFYGHGLSILGFTELDITVVAMSVYLVVSH